MGHPSSKGLKAASPSTREETKWEKKERHLEMSIQGIRCVETGKRYRSAMDAYRETGIYPKGILKCCKGINRTAGGYHWKYIGEPSPKFISVLFRDNQWNVFYKKMLLKSFRSRELATIYALDSAIEDVGNQCYLSH